jgi:hypothetical protein
LVTLLSFRAAKVGRGIIWLLFQVLTPTLSRVVSFALLALGCLWRSGIFIFVTVVLAISLGSGPLAATTVLGLIVIATGVASFSISGAGGFVLLIFGLGGSCSLVPL